MSREQDPIAANEQSICLGCGLCCDGTIFAFVPISNEDDAEGLETRGIEIATRPRGRGFNLPCAALQDTTCSIYVDRPSTCRHFRCGVLEGHESGALGTSEATALIATAITLRDEVRHGLDRFVPADVPTSLAARLDTIVELVATETTDAVDHAARRGELSEVLLDAAALRIHIGNHFHSSERRTAELSEERGVPGPTHDVA